MGAGHGREPKPMMADYAEAVQKHRIDLLYLDGELAALIEMVPAADYLLIENVAVSPALQGRGLGRMLLSHAEQIAASLGYDEIKLYTTSFSRRMCSSTLSLAIGLTEKRHSKTAWWST